MFFSLDLFCSAETSRTWQESLCLSAPFKSAFVCLGAVGCPAGLEERLIRNQKQVSCKWDELCGGQDCESHERAFFPTCQWSVTGSPETYPSDGGAGPKLPISGPKVSLKSHFQLVNRWILFAPRDITIFFSRKMISPSTLAPSCSVLIFEWISRSRKGRHHPGVSHDSFGFLWPSV